MRNELLSQITTALPYSLAERITGYAASVDAAIDDIFRDAGVKYDLKLHEQIVFLAGIKRLLSIIDSTYWLLDNSNEILERNETYSVRIGSTEYSRTGSYYSEIQKTRADLRDRLMDHGILEILESKRYPEILIELSSEHR